MYSDFSGHPRRSGSGSYRMCVHLQCYWVLPQTSPKKLYQILLPPSEYENVYCSTSLSWTNTVRFFHFSLPNGYEMASPVHWCVADYQWGKLPLMLTGHLALHFYELPIFVLAFYLIACKRSLPILGECCFGSQLPDPYSRDNNIHLLGMIWSWSWRPSPVPRTCETLKNTITISTIVLNMDKVQDRKYF